MEEKVGGLGYGNVGVEVEIEVSYVLFKELRVVFSWWRIWGEYEIERRKLGIDCKGLVLNMVLRSLVLIVEILEN